MRNRGGASEASLEPWFLLNYGGQVVSAIIPPAYPAHHLAITVTSVGFVMAFEPYLWEGIAIMLAYALLAMIPCVVVFQRREIR